MSTNSHKEKISAFLDDEMHRDEVMSFSLSSEQEDANVIRRYQLAGDALRGEVSAASFIDVSQAVHDALQGESLAVESNNRPLNQRVADSAPVGRPGGFSWSSWFRPAAGMAVAASVALVMVVTLSGPENASLTPVAVNQAPVPVVSNAPVMRVADDSITDTKARALDQRLVNRHLEFATQDALQGRLPYVRAVSYTRKQ